MKRGKILAILAVVVTVLSTVFNIVAASPSVYASTVSDQGNNPKKLAEIEMYAQALYGCIGDSLYTIHYDTSGSGEYKVENVESSYSTFLGDNYFFNALGGAKLYSPFLEQRYGADSSNKEQVDNGYLYCGESKTRTGKGSGTGGTLIFKDALRSFGLDPSDTNVLKSLYCDGSNPGILDVYTSYSNDDAGFLTGPTYTRSNNCGEAFDLWVEYGSEKEENPIVDLYAEPADGRQEYFEGWVSRNVGNRWGDITQERVDAMQYAAALESFRTVCGTQFSARSVNPNKEIAIVDNVYASGTVYYAVNDPSAKKTDKQDHYGKYIYDVFDETKYSCTEIAAGITSDGAAAYKAALAAGGGSATPTVFDPGSPVGGDDSTTVAEDKWAQCSVGPFSWVICGLLEAVSGFCDAVYEWIEGQMQIGPEFFAGTPDQGLNSAWGTFRDMANVVFIILMLIAIISQLTGYGLSNYNIKRILPRLIVVAILLNLSYYICQIAVDLSNILGSQFNALLGSIEVASSSTSGIEWTWTGLITGAMTAGVLVIGAALIWMNLGALLLAILAAALSLILVFAILLIRKVAIILLIALAPLAFVCLLLPNTESLFKKWFSIIKALLIVYPICGLLMGAGALASNIAFAAIDAASVGTGDTQWIIRIAAMAMESVPFFAVIVLTKGSLNALGSIGAKLSGTLAGATSKLSGAIKTSAAGQALQMGDQNRRLSSLTDPNSLRNKIQGGIGKVGFGKRTLGGLARKVGLSDAYARKQGAAIAERASLDRQVTAGLEGMYQQMGVGEDGDTQGEVLISEALTAAEKGDSNQLQALVQRYDETGRDGDLLTAFRKDGRGMSAEVAQTLQQMLGKTHNLKDSSFAAAFMKSLQDHVAERKDITSFDDLIHSTTRNGKEIGMDAQLGKMDAAKLSNTSKTGLTGFMGGLEPKQKEALFSQVKVGEMAKAYANMSGDKADKFNVALQAAAGAYTTSTGNNDYYQVLTSRLGANDLGKMSDDAAMHLTSINSRGIRLDEADSQTGDYLKDAAGNSIFDSTERKYYNTANGKYDLDTRDRNFVAVGTSASAAGQEGALRSGILASELDTRLTDQQRANIQNPIVQNAARPRPSVGNPIVPPAGRSTVNPNVPNVTRRTPNPPRGP